MPTYTVKHPTTGVVEEWESIVRFADTSDKGKQDSEELANIFCQKGMEALSMHDLGDNHYHVITPVRRNARHYIKSLKVKNEKTGQIIELISQKGKPS